MCLACEQDAMWFAYLQRKGLITPDGYLVEQPPSLLDPVETARRRRRARKARAERQRAGRQKRLCLRRSSGSMTDPTSLTLAQARDALRARELSALELTEAHLSAIESARVLNAFVLETPERARKMARASDARLAKGEGGPLEGMPLGIKDLFCTEGVRTTACSHILDDFMPTYESTVTSNLWRDGAVLLGKLNNDEFAMGSSNETSCFGPVACAVAPARERRQTRTRRLIGRIGGGGRSEAVRRCHRDRHRRLDPPAGGVLRYRRTKTDLRPLLALGHRGVCIVARSGRAFCAQRARLRDHAALDGGP